MRVQPSEAVYMKTNVKMPGLAGVPVATELDLSYGTRFDDKMADSPSAYTRLILDCLRGKQASFVRDDELRAAWKIFTPLLHDIDAGKKQPTKYKAFFPRARRGRRVCVALFTSATLRTSGTRRQSATPRCKATAVAGGSEDGEIAGGAYCGGGASGGDGALQPLNRLRVLRGTACVSRLRGTVWLGFGPESVLYIGSRTSVFWSGLACPPRKEPGCLWTRLGPPYE
eukprot:TRINITY_DN1940_c0_g1_i13.p1 TRINITY_DN1940_c0_g1~~TRINITY_DN1940_c0_g1_i13.p1  ORF type:complete len:244 (-),score=50.43 TRINITY_DN1940_c0_g1_i13:50-730(-)